MRRLFLIIVLSVLASTAHAHQLNVFAFVQDNVVIVETKFSTGRIPVSGEVRVLNVDAEIVLQTKLETDGTVRFPLDQTFSADGITIEVTTGDGHEDYWILTPQDIENGMASSSDDVSEDGAES